MISTTFRRLGIALVALCGMSAAPAAALTLIAGLGQWDATTAVTSHSAPDASFAFFFTLPSPLPGDIDPALGYTTDAITDFVFELDGVDVGEPLDSVTFYAFDDGGLFDLVFASGTIQFFGDDIGSTGKLRSGIYLAEAGLLGDEDSAGFGFVGVLGAVPEPATWAMLIAGFALTGVALRRRSHATA